MEKQKELTPLGCLWNYIDIFGQVTDDKRDAQYLEEVVGVVPDVKPNDSNLEVEVEYE